MTSLTTWLVWVAWLLNSEETLGEKVWWATELVDSVLATSAHKGKNIGTVCEVEWQPGSSKVTGLTESRTPNPWFQASGLAWFQALHLLFFSGFTWWVHFSPSHPCFPMFKPVQAQPKAGRSLNFAKLKNFFFIFQCIGNIYSLYKMKEIDKQTEENRNHP